MMAIMPMPMFCRLRPTRSSWGRAVPASPGACRRAPALGPTAVPRTCSRPGALQRARMVSAAASDKGDGGPVKNSNDDSELLPRANQLAGEVRGWMSEFEETNAALQENPDDALLKGRMKALMAKLLGPQAPRITLSDVAATLERHQDDPSFYTVHFRGGKTALYHDPTDVVGDLRKHLSQKILPLWCTPAKGRHLLPQYVSGGIKSGKSFLTNVILPAVMAEMGFSNASSIQMNASEVTTNRGFDELCRSMLQGFLVAFRENNITTPAIRRASSDSAYASLKSIFRTMDVPLTIQMDEVQHLFTPRLLDGKGVDRATQIQVAQLLKALWCGSNTFCHWTVTGSSMALFWVHLGMMPANGISPLTHRSTVHLPHEHSTDAKTKVLLHLLEADGRIGPKGALPPDYEEMRDYAENCAMLAFAYADYDPNQSITKHLEQLDRDKLAKESTAEWRDVLVNEFDLVKRRALAGLYDTVGGCKLSELGSSGLEEMLATLSCPIASDPQRVYLRSHFHRAGLAMCVTLDGQIIDPLTIPSGKRLNIMDAFVQLSLIGNKAQRLLYASA